MPARQDLTGVRFGRLVCTEYVGRNKHRQSLWRCVCDCGGADGNSGEKVATVGDLRKAERGEKGGTASCGCIRREVAAATLQAHVGVTPGECRICANEIPPSPGRREVFCSDDCRNEAERQRRAAIWQRLTPEQRAAHCARVCAAQKAKFAGERVCRFCGTTFIGPAKRVFCSDACLDDEKKLGTYRHRHNKKKAILAMALAKTELEQRMDDIPFTCPLCGSHYFGRDIASDGTPLPTVRCHGDSSAGNRTCSWQGMWPTTKDESDE